MEATSEYKIGIIGCGTTGKGLFDFLRGFPFHIVMVCRTEEAAGQFDKSFERQLNRAVKFNLINRETFNSHRLKTVITSDTGMLAECNLIIETITENADKKKKLFRQLESIVSQECILTSNTSSIFPDELFSEMKYPERCVGLHFFFPVSMENFVEINVARQTGDKTIESIKDFLKSIRKNHLVLTGKNHFMINRIFLKMQAGCCRILQEEKVNVTQIDEIVRKNLFSAGIFRFFDTVGNDVMLQSVKNYLHYEDDPDFFLPLVECLEEKVSQGNLGKKTKSGFYTYPLKTWSDESESLDETVKRALLQKITGWYLDGVYDALKRNICSKDELEQIVKEYLMVEKSPFELAGERGNN